VEVGYTVLQ